MNPIKTVDGVGFIHGDSNHPLLASAKELGLCYLSPNAAITKLYAHDSTYGRYSYHNAYWGYWDENKEDRYKLAKIAAKAGKAVYYFNAHYHYNRPMSLVDEFKNLDDVDFIIKYCAVKFKVAYWFSLLREGRSMKDMLAERFANFANDCLCLRCKKRRAAYVSLGLCYKCKCWVKSSFANDEEYRGITRPYPIRSIAEWRQLRGKDVELLQWG